MNKRDSDSKIVGERNAFMKNYRVFKYLTLGALVVGAFGVTYISHQQPEVIEEAVAWSGTQTPNVDVDYYSTCEGKTGTDLKSALSNFNKPKSPSYDWERYEAADEAEGVPGSILSLYTRHTIAKGNHCGNYAWDKWNREHVFTQTKFPQSKTDNHNIFACEGKINGIRSDYPFAEISTDSYVEVFNHVTGCKCTGSTFEPCDEAKGEVARACMYVTLYFPYSLSEIFVDASLCAKWHAEHPVTDREIYRNNVIYGLQGNRNPFIDHPSYANSIFGANYTEPDPLSEAPSTEPAIKSVTINPSTLDLDISGVTTGTLGATVHAVNGASESVTWSSSNTSVATVSNGVVTALSVGTSTITATSTFDSSKKGTCVVSVRDSNQLSPEVTSVSVSPATLNLDLNGTKTGTLIASISAYDGASETVVWSSSNTNVASVDNGVVTALSVGTTTISATSTFDSSKKGTCLVTVVDSTTSGGETTPIDDGGNEQTPIGPSLVSIDVTPPTKTNYLIGEELDLTGFKVIAHYDDNSTRDVTEYAKIQLDTSSEGSITIFVTYTEKDETHSAPITFIVNAKVDDSMGCAGSLIATSLLISITSLLGASLIFIKKNRKFED